MSSDKADVRLDRPQEHFFIGKTDKVIFDADMYRRILCDCLGYTGESVPVSPQSGRQDLSHVEIGYVWLSYIFDESLFTKRLGTAGIPA